MQLTVQKLVREPPLAENPNFRKMKLCRHCCIRYQCVAFVYFGLAQVIC